MTIQYVPWEDKDNALKQLDLYVSEHPEAKFYYVSNTSRPDTVHLFNGEDTVAEISLKLLESAIAENKNIGDGVSFRDVIKSTRLHNPDFFESKIATTDKSISITDKIKNYINGHKKTVRVGAAAVTLGVTFGLGSIVMNHVFGNSDPVYEMTQKDYTQILDDAKLRLVKINEMNKKNTDFAEYQAKELFNRLNKLEKDELTKDDLAKLEKLIENTKKYISLDKNIGDVK